MRNRFSIGPKDPLDQEGITRFTYVAEHVICMNCDSEHFNVEVTGMFKPDGVVFVWFCPNCLEKRLKRNDSND